MEKFAKSYPRAHKYLGHAGSALKIAQQAYSMAQTVAGIVNSEKKFIDVANNWDCDTTPSVVCLTGVAQGDTKETRNGDSIALKSLDLNLQVWHDTTVPQEVKRVMLVKDYDNNAGTALTVAQILESSTTIAKRNKDFPIRFKVLMDKVIAVNTSVPIMIKDKYIKFKMGKDRKGNPTKSVKATFSAATATDTARGHIYLIMFSNTANASTAAKIYYSSRVRFYDN